MWGIKGKNSRSGRGYGRFLTDVGREDGGYSWQDKPARWIADRIIAWRKFVLGKLEGWDRRLTVRQRIAVFYLGLTICCGVLMYLMNRALRNPLVPVGVKAIDKMRDTDTGTGTGTGTGSGWSHGSGLGFGLGLGLGSSSGGSADQNKAGILSGKISGLESNLIIEPKNIMKNETRRNFEYKY